MILVDFSCNHCGNVYETLIEPDIWVGICSSCGQDARRIITSGGVSGNQEVPVWLKSTLEVVDKTDKRPHVQEFVKNPTRENYKKWMKTEGIKPAAYTEHGAPPVYKRPPEPDLNVIAKNLYEQHRNRKRIEVR